jgi:nitrogen fixation protein NifB
MKTTCRNNPGEHEKELQLTLAIAPNANHCKRESDNEGTVPALLPIQARQWLENLRKSGREITDIHFSGPGDAVTSWPATAACMDILHNESGPFSLTCLGLGAAERTADLVKYGITTVTLLVDTLHKKTAEALYCWIRPGKKTVPLHEGVSLLLREQSHAVKTMTDAGLDVVIRTVVHSGINDTEIAEIAAQMAALGAGRMEIIGNETFRQAASPYLKTTILSTNNKRPLATEDRQCENPVMPKPSPMRPNLAVASSNGMDINLHLGQAEKLLIYGPRDDGLACLLETRNTPKNGEANRWQALADLCQDCFAILASHAGDTPRRQLAQSGIELLLQDDQIEGVVDMLYGGGKKRKCK